MYAAVMAHSPEARGIVPPRKDAVLSSQVATAPTQRDAHLLAIESEGAMWLETDVRLLRSGLRRECLCQIQTDIRRWLAGKRDASQKREASLACELLNRMLELGRSQSYPVS